MSRCTIRLRKTLSLVLPALASVGVAATAVLAVRATPKAMTLIEADKHKKHGGNTKAYTKKDAVKACWKCYIPAATVGAATVGCIFGAAVLSKKQQASIASAYALLEHAYRDYSGKVKERYGENVHKDILKEISVEKSRDVRITASNLTSDCCLDFEDSCEDELLFFDSISGRYFQSTISKVLQAEYHLNRNYALGACVSLNDFYDFLGIEKIDGGETVGWGAGYFDDEIMWIDFDHQKTVTDDGLECYIITVIFEPVADFSP